MILHKKARFVKRFPNVFFGFQIIVREILRSDLSDGAPSYVRCIFLCIVRILFAVIDLNFGRYEHNVVRSLGDVYIRNPIFMRVLLDAAAFS